MLQNNTNVRAFSGKVWGWTEQNDPCSEVSREETKVRNLLVKKIQ